jgi:hypothetical protein
MPILRRVATADPALFTHGARFAMADEVTRSNAATALVGGVGSSTGSGWHIEDAVEFRKRPHQRFFLTVAPAIVHP